VQRRGGRAARRETRGSVPNRQHRAPGGAKETLARRPTRTLNVLPPLPGRWCTGEISPHGLHSVRLTADSVSPVATARRPLRGSRRRTTVSTFELLVFQPPQKDCTRNSQAASPAFLNAQRSTLNAPRCESVRAEFGAVSLSRSRIVLNRSESCRNASTIRGSNCVPRPSTISRIASSCGKASL